MLSKLANREPKAIALSETTERLVTALRDQVRKLDDLSNRTDALAADVATLIARPTLTPDTPKSHLPALAIACVSVAIGIGALVFGAAKIRGLEHNLVQNRTDSQALNARIAATESSYLRETQRAESYRSALGIETRRADEAERRCQVYGRYIEFFSQNPSDK